MEKEFLKETLENILKKLDSAEVKRHDWYISLFPEECYEKMDYYDGLIKDSFEGKRHSPEYVLAKEAIQYPELHSLMEEVVLKLIVIGEQGSFSNLWENELTQAGGSLASELAVYDKKYIPLYYRYIQTNDLDHEVYQLDDMMAIFSKWTGEAEIIPLLLYRSEWGQRAQMYTEGDEWDKSKAKKYLKEVVEYFQEHWSFDVVEDEEETDDLDELNEMLTPIFQMMLELSDEEMEEFIRRFNNQMAEEDIPTIESLVTKTSSKEEKIRAEDKNAFAKAAKKENLEEIKKLVEKGVPANTVVAKESVFAKVLSLQTWYVSVLKDDENEKRRKEQQEQLKIVAYLSSKLESAYLANDPEATYTYKTFLGESGNAKYSELINTMIDAGYPVQDDRYISSFMGLYDLEAAKKIIAIRGIDNGESLISAVQMGNLEVTEYLLSLNVPVNTPYIYSSGNKAYALHTAITSFVGNKDIIQKLLDAGADPNLKGMNGTALQTIKDIYYPKIDQEIIDLITKYSKEN